MDQLAFWICIALIFVAVLGINYLILYFFRWATGRQLLLHSFLVSVAWLISNVANYYLLDAVIARLNVTGGTGFVVFLSIGISVSSIFVAATLALLKSHAKASGTLIKILLTSILIAVLSLGVCLGGLLVTKIVTEVLKPEFDESGE